MNVVKVLPVRIVDLISDCGLSPVNDNPLFTNVLLRNPSIFVHVNNKLAMTAYTLSYEYLLSQGGRIFGGEACLQLINGMGHSISMAKARGLNITYNLGIAPEEIARKPWNDAVMSLDRYSPYTLWSILKKPFDEIEGDALNTTIITGDGYLVSITEINSADSVTEEMLSSLLSGELVKKKMGL